MKLKQKNLEQFVKSKLSNSKMIFGGSSGEDDDDIERPKSQVPPGA